MKIRKGLLALAFLAALTTVSCGSSRLHIAVTRSATLTPAEGAVLMSANDGPPQAFATDLNGNIIWKFDHPSYDNTYHPIPIQFLPNGNLIAEWATGPGIAPCPDCAERNTVEEIDLAGNVVWQYTNQQLQDALNTAGFNIKLGQLSHDAIGLPNGHTLVLATDVKTVSGQSDPIQGAAIIDLDQNQKPVWVWDAFDHLDVNRHPFGLPDWIHPNAIVYSPDDGNLLLSSRHQSWVIKIKYQNGSGDGSIIWRLGYQGDFTLLNGGPADWFYGQHAPIFLTPNSTGVFELGLFDNGNSRIMNDSGAKCGDSGQPACYSTVPIFEIDEANRTAKILWRDKLDFFSNAVGNMQVLDNGHVWFDAGRVDGNAIIREVTREDNPQTVLEMRVNTTVYRAVHVPRSKLGLQ